ncbi:MAG TPA: ATP-binding cassette domain-containing protein [Polyangiaceae bacterium]|nr:ATP-binding cassette domain-containing protein [Polyangiaceae bacterium]
MSRRLFVPEVIQTSAMDCGPAALKALFAGFGVYLSYGRLREACHTDVDGTSIDALEEIALSLGGEVEQRMLPIDHLLLRASTALPAIVVVRLPDGALHFVVVWRAYGGWLQVMDPAAGRVWVRRKAFLENLFVHRQSVPRAAFEEWIASPEFEATLRERAAALGVKWRCWSDRAHQDAALRLAGALAARGKLRRGAESESFLELCAENRAQIPAEYWAASPTSALEDECELSGAVLISARACNEPAAPPLDEVLARIRREPPPRAWSFLWSEAMQGGRARACVLALSVVCSAGGAVLEALLFRGVLDPNRHLHFGAQRLAALVALLVFACVLLLVKRLEAQGALSLGRWLELRMRSRFLLKVPRLDDRYFQARAISDMAMRAHAVRLLRDLPALALELVRLMAAVLFTVSAIAWLYPGSALLALAAALVACVLPLALQPLFVERDLRVREMATGLARFYLDALLGAQPVRAHGAGATLKAVYGPQLESWARAGLRQQHSLAVADALQLALTLAPVIALVWRESLRAADPAGLLLLSYWACTIPAVGSQLAFVASNLPAVKNALLRLLEPLGAPGHEPPISKRRKSVERGVAVEFDAVSVTAGGHRVLEDVSARIEPGEHVAIVGASGAGKSSLVGLLLGWHTAASGAVRIDGEQLDAERLASLRGQTAWVDAQVHLFQRTLLDNLSYGNDEAAAGMQAVLAQSELGPVLRTLPRGLQTELGDGGAFVSGGEGQRVRVGRAFARAGTRLAIWDEPTRGLERELRQRVLRTAREHFSRATLFYVTHHVTDTLDFDRVLVMDHGRLVEQGAPRMLEQSPGSHYQALLAGAAEVEATLRRAQGFQRFVVAGGRLRAEGQV